MFVFYSLFILFRIAWWLSAGKELPLWRSALAVFILCHLGPFPLGICGRMWNSTVSVIDLCLFIYFTTIQIAIRPFINRWKFVGEFFIQNMNLYWYKPSRVTIWLCLWAELANTLLKISNLVTYSVFCMSDILNAVIDSWDRNCICSNDRIYFTIVYAHTKYPIRFWYKITSRTPVTLARFNKVVVQHILNVFPEILLFCRVYSIWMLFHLQCMMVNVVFSCRNVRK